MNAPLTNISPFHNVEIEQELLGAILVKGGHVIDQIDRIVTADDFHEPVHQALFRAFQEAHENGRPINPTLASAALGTASGTELAPGVSLGQYVARVASAACLPHLAPEYARQVSECSQRRKVSAVLDHMQVGLAAHQSPAEIAGAGIEMLDEVVGATSTSSCAPIDIGEAAYQAGEELTIAMQNPSRLRGVSTGLHDLDAKTGGLQNGSLVILAGRPGMGKSAVAASMVRAAAFGGFPALLFSLEMSSSEIANRITADLCFDDGGDPITYSDIARGNLSSSDHERVVQAERALHDVPLRIDPTGGLTVAQIAARARKYKVHLERKGKRLGVVFIDHLQLIRPSARYSGQRVNEIAEITGSLKSLAKELDLPVVALAQLNRAVEQRGNKRPSLADLRDSGSIEQDADVVMLVFREAYYLAKDSNLTATEDDARIGKLIEVSNLLEIDVAKQRGGPTGVVKLSCNIGANAIRDEGVINE